MQAGCMGGWRGWGDYRVVAGREGGVADGGIAGGRERHGVGLSEVLLVEWGIWLGRGIRLEWRTGW